MALSIKLNISTGLCGARKANIIRGYRSATGIQVVKLERGTVAEQHCFVSSSTNSIVQNTTLQIKAKLIKCFFMSLWG